MTTELRKPVLCNLSLLGKNTFDKKKSNHKQTNKQTKSYKQTNTEGFNSKKMYLQ